MCKKEKYEKHLNVLVFFFAFAMLVIPIFQKLSLGTRSIRGGYFLVVFFASIVHELIEFQGTEEYSDYADRTNEHEGYPMPRLCELIKRHDRKSVYYRGYTYSSADDY